MNLFKFLKNKYNCFTDKKYKRCLELRKIVLEDIHESGNDDNIIIIEKISSKLFDLSDNVNREIFWNLCVQIEEKLHSTFFDNLTDDEFIYLLNENLYIASFLYVVIHDKYGNNTEQATLKNKFYRYSDYLSYCRVMLYQFGEHEMEKECCLGYLTRKECKHLGCPF